MRVRNILLASAASVSLFLIASNTPEAYAQRGTFLSPSSQWAVTKVAGNPAAGQAGYCAVAKRYEGDAILTIARNQGTETSLALDLQKPLFNTANPLAVTLDPGAGEQRDYSISPASAQAFVVRLGRDEAFFNAIDRTGILRVEVVDKSYVFNISDIDAGQTKLNACLASAVTPAAGNDAPVSFSTQVESKSNQEFIEKLNSRIQSLENQNTSLQAKIVDVEREVITPARAVDVVSGGVDQSKALRVETLRAENLRLKAALQAGELELRSDKLNLLEADNARLSSQVSQVSDASGKIAALEKQINDLLVENTRLQNAQNSTENAELSALEDNIQSLQAENNSLKVALAEQSESDVSAQLRVRIEQIESENRVLKEKASVDKQAAYQSTGERVREIRAQHAQEVSSLRAQIEGLRLAHNANAADNAEIETLNGQLASLREDNLLLQQELHEKALMATNVTAHNDNADIAALDFENKKLQSQIDKSIKTHMLQDKAIVALEAENVALKDQLETVNIASADVESLNEKFDILNEKLRISEEKFAAQEQKLASLETENTDLKIALDSRVEESLSLASALDDVSTLREEISIKDAQLAEFNGVPERLQSLLEDYQSAKAEKIKLENENEIMREQQADNADIAAQLAEAQALNDKFIEKLDGLQKNVLAMSELNNEVKSLTLALADKESKLSELDALQGEFSQVVAENAALKEETLKLASAFEAASNDQQAKADDAIMDENVELRRALSSVLAKVEGQNEIIKNSDEKMSSVLAKNEALQGQLDFAAQLMAANDIDAAEAPLKTAKVEKKNTAKRVEKPAPEAKVILASASSPAVVKSKPSVVRKKETGDDVSFAETLAQIEPAAGEQNDVQEQSADVIETPQVVEDAQDFMGRELNQAQIYEEQLKRSLENKERIDESRAEAIDVETLEDGLLEAEVETDNDIDAVVESASTVDELPTLEEDTEATQDVTDNAVEDAQKFVAQKERVQDDVENVSESESVEVKMSADPFEGIAVQGENEASSERAVASVVDDGFDDAAPLPKSVKQPKSSAVEIEPIEAEEAQSNAPVVASGNNAIERVLMMSNVAGISNVRAVNSKPGAYQWRAGSLFGSGEQRQMNSPAQFDGFVKDYLTKTEERCPGDFAIVPDNTKESGSMRVDSYEIACVGSDVSSSASLIFYNEGATFNVMAHETEASKMADAMAVRDKIFASLTSGRDS